MDGADVDDLAGSFGLKEMPDHLLCGEEDTFEVDVEDTVVIFFGHFPKRRVGFDTGVVDEDIEPAEMLDGCGDELPYVSRVRKIRLDHEATTARCFDGAQRFLRSTGGTVVVDDYIRALLGETFGDCAADALAAAGDESDFACESHMCLLFFIGSLSSSSLAECRECSAVSDTHSSVLPDKGFCRHHRPRPCCAGARDLIQMKFPGGWEIGPLMPNTAS